MRTYAGIADPSRPGLFVAENAALLRRYAYIEQRQFVAQCARFPGTATWECKHALARQAWEDAQHAQALRERIVTMRTSPRLLDECPDPALQQLMDAALAAPDEATFLAGLHGVIKPALLSAYRWHLATTNHVADFPTVRELDIIVREETAQIAWAAEAIAELAGPEAAADAARIAATFVAATPEPPAAPARSHPGPALGGVHTPAPGAPERALRWQEHIRAHLAAAGGILGTDARAPAPPPPEPFRLSRHPRRDPRFAVHFQFNEPGDPPAETTGERLIFMMRGRLNELAATENVASAIHELSGELPWEALLEFSRHMWDEARHSMLGQAVIESLGRDPRDWPLRIGPGYSYLSVGPWERYAHLGLNVEQGMMRYPPGKRQEFEWCRDVAKNRLAAMYQDYDWSDEVYHVQIARRWTARLAGGAAAPGDGAEVAAGLREFAAAASRRMAARTEVLGRLWAERRAQGRSLGDPDPLPDWTRPGVEEQAPSGDAWDTYAQPELALTAQEVERDLERAGSPEE